MPYWLQVLSTLVAAGFTLGTVARGVATWVWTNTIKRDLGELRAEIDRTNKRLDEIKGLEVELKLLRQHVVDRLASIEANAQEQRRQDRRREDWRAK